MAEEGNVPEEVCLYGSWMHGVGDDVVGLEPPRKLFGHEQVGQLCGAVDSFGIVVPARRYYRMDIELRFIRLRVLDEIATAYSSHRPTAKPKTYWVLHQLADCDTMTSILA